MYRQGMSFIQGGSHYSVDNFFQKDWWFFNIRINDYQLMTVFWNLLLCLIPFLLCLLLIAYFDRNGFKRSYHKMIAGLIFFVWLLFVPNTAYVMTDVRHLLNYCPYQTAFKVCDNNLWVILFFFSYSVIGWVTFYYALLQMRNFVVRTSGEMVAKLFILIIIPILALGVMLGLVNRWNSWEVFIYPTDFLSNLFQYISLKKYYINWAIFSIYFYLLYGIGLLVFRKKIDLR